MLIVLRTIGYVNATTRLTPGGLGMADQTLEKRWEIARTHEMWEHSWNVKQVQFVVTWLSSIKAPLTRVYDISYSVYFFYSFPHARTPTTHVFGREMSSELEPEVEELVLPGLVGKKDEEEKERADKEAGQKLKQLLLGGDSDGDSDTEDDDDVSQT